MVKDTYTRCRTRPQCDKQGHTVTDKNIQQGEGTYNVEQEHRMTDMHTERERKHGAEQEYIKGGRPL